MELWIAAHLATEHRWDRALWLEAMALQVEADMRDLWSRLFADDLDFSFVRWKVMFGYGLAPLPFVGIRVVDV